MHYADFQGSLTEVILNRFKVVYDFENSFVYIQFYALYAHIFNGMNVVELQEEVWCLGRTYGRVLNC